MASMVVVTGKSRGHRVHLGSQPISVGRDEGCDIQVVDDLVSRRHMEVRPDGEGDGFIVQDLHSTNGVFIDGSRVDQATLRDGTVIVIGESKLLFTDQEFDDGQSALSFFKLRGEHVRSTMIRAPEPREQAT